MTEKNLNERLSYFQKYVSDGSRAKRQQIFQNFTNSPLLTGEPTDLVVKILAVPELHLLIG